MIILNEEEILSRGKNLLEQIGYDPIECISTDIETGEVYNGLAYTLFDDGNIESYSYYVDGEEDIQSVEFYYNGKLKNYCEFKDGLIEGEMIQWAENGQMIYYGKYENDEIKSLKKWDENGELLEEKSI